MYRHKDTDDIIEVNVPLLLTSLILLFATLAAWDANIGSTFFLCAYSDTMFLVVLFVRGLRDESGDHFE